MPFKSDSALQNIPLLKQPFKTQPQIENEDVIWSPPYTLLPVTRTNKRRALSLQEVELDDWFLILHIVTETCTICFMHEFNISFVFHIYNFWIDVLDLNQPFNWGAKIWEHFKWNSYEGFNLEDCTHRTSCNAKYVSRIVVIPAPLINLWCLVS